MAGKLSINFEQLRGVIEDYTRAIEQLSQALNAVDRAIADLRSSKWDTDASVAYFAQYSDRWRVSVMDHLVALNELRNGLRSAYDEYSRLFEKIDDLCYSLG